jgi:hypothetical protein
MQLGLMLDAIYLSVVEVLMGSQLSLKGKLVNGVTIYVTYLQILLDQCFNILKQILTQVLSFGQEIMPHMTCGWVLFQMWFKAQSM